MSVKRAIFSSVVVGTLVLSGCGSNGSETTSGDGQGAQTTSAGPESTPTPTPTPTPDPTELKPGTNHSYEAAEYAYEAKDVHNWLHGEKTQAANYPEKKIAFLTFDDGPTNITPKVLEELKKAGAPATFFVIAGELGVEGPGGDKHLKQTIEDGNSVCIHTYSHKYSYLYPGRRANAEHIEKDYDRALKSVRNVLGEEYEVHGHRYPGGHGWRKMGAADKALEKKSSYWIDWNSENGDGTDSASSTGEGRAKRALSTLSDSPNVAVILMHDFRDNDVTAEGIAPLVKELKKRGYEFGVIN